MLIRIWIRYICYQVTDPDPRKSNGSDQMRILLNKTDQKLQIYKFLFQKPKLNQKYLK